MLRASTAGQSHKQQQSHAQKMQTDRQHDQKNIRYITDDNDSAMIAPLASVMQLVAVVFHLDSADAFQI